MSSTGCVADSICIIDIHGSGIERYACYGSCVDVIIRRDYQYITKIHLVGSALYHIDKIRTSLGFAFIADNMEIELYYSEDSDFVIHMGGI